MKFTANSDSESMLAEIRLDVWNTRDLTGRQELSPRVIEAMRTVPRHAFVPDELQDRAYVNRAQPIGCGQTISQPYIVALMTDLIDPQAADVVLEVGTGSGYQAAVLSTLVDRVYSLEVVAELAESARQRLHRLAYDNVEVRLGDGHRGWPEHAPYDAIVVTAAASRIPEALIEQLKPGGSLVIPVGKAFFGQQLQLLRKGETGGLEVTDILPVVFVPFVEPA
jgi:protein-L-isoaspartate(D-aspartate) O-methyltransferase